MREKTEASDTVEEGRGDSNLDRNGGSSRKEGIKVNLIISSGQLNHLRLEVYWTKIYGRRCRVERKKSS